jgi:hypothetical protein
VLNPRIDISHDLDGEPVVLACFDLGDELRAASSHAVAAMAAERFRVASMSVDDVLELRELTALADELGDPAPEPGTRTLALRPARLSAFRDSVALSRLRGLLVPLEELCAEALRAALSPGDAMRRR